MLLPLDCSSLKKHHLEEIFSLNVGGFRYCKRGGGGRGKRRNGGGGSKWASSVMSLVFLE